MDFKPSKIDFVSKIAVTQVNPIENDKRYVFFRFTGWAIFLERLKIPENVNLGRIFMRWSFFLKKEAGQYLHILGGKNKNSKVWSWAFLAKQGSSIE